jgi:NAD-dependent deacetylase
MDRVLRTLEVCTVFVAIGTSGVVEPAASFVGQTKARTFYVGPEEPLNLASFDETFTGKAGELLPTMFDVCDLRPSPRSQAYRRA